MLKEHPKGLYVLFFTEMWERFGYYTMVAIFVLFLSEKFKWDAATVTNVYGLFIAAVYFMPIIGGWIADNLLGYGKTIIIGAVIMVFGYGFMAIPHDNEMLLYVTLFIISLGNGLFKANISVLVGNLYNHSEEKLKDAAYNIFYMGINIGAFYAPLAASNIKSFLMDNYSFTLVEGYYAGFAASSIGMIISLIIFLSLVS